MQTTSLPPYLRSLNPEQRRAVQLTEGPVLVLAGAGSGKTKTLVHRIVHLIRGRGVDPARIVAVTFTNRAAEEMRERVKAYAGAEARQVLLSTFHSLGARILREHAHRLGLPARFAIYSTPDQLAALRTACAEISIDDDSFDLKRIARRISDWKSRRVDPVTAKREVAAGITRGNRADAYAVLAADAYAKYEEVLRASGAVDFDDLLLLPVRLLSEDEEVRRAVWKRWHYVMVDEYQDTNAVQFEMARLLAGSRRNLCVVGDDDQSIYAFRGADVGNILEFERHFPGAAVVKLEQNYRSTQRILEAANAVIAGNARRHPKRLRTDNGPGAPIDYCEYADERAEAEGVAREIQTRRLTHKLAWGDFAVLYRTNTQARVFEEALRERNIPYRVVGGTSFFERKEVADATAYLRAVAHPHDEIAIRRIINYPARGIGRTTVLRIAELAAQRGVPFAVALESLDAGDVGAAPARAIAGFLDLLAAARQGLAAAEAESARTPFHATLPPIARWADEFFRQIGLEDEIRKDPRNARSADARSDNLKDLVGSIARYERRVWDDAATRMGGPLLEAAAEPPEDWSPPTLAEALARLALVDMNEEDDRRTDDASVALMTLHSAKGLEFSDVFLVGLEEGILPHARSLDAAADAEEASAADPLAEERRLLYVGITRARRRLSLSLCKTRGKSAAPTVPSRYLADIPPELLNVRTEGAALSPEESAELRKNFFSQMRAMLGSEDA
ncbi:MAG: UvrD-helicase domain-containing protein [Gemmatimonadetes bacterium]|nr:UvrD-helicase domain-containing protein [Gemmatimonadota bacterium]